MRLVLLLASAAVCMGGCGVLAAPASSGDLPDAELGPYRKLDELESQFPPFVRLDFTASLGGPWAVPGPGGDFEVYYHATVDESGVWELRRARSAGPTSFASDEVVLEPEAADGPGVVDPSAVVGPDGSTWLFFAAASGDGIGLARSDGGAFVREQVPIVDRPQGGAAVGSPSAIGVDGTLRIYFTRGDAIELAVSEEGEVWEQQGPVLTAGEAGSWDAGGVSDPAVVLYGSPLGTRSVRLYYTGRSAEDPPVRGIGVAASFDGVTGFRRLVGNPLLTGDRDESGPALLEVDGATLLYFSQRSASERRGIGAAVNPPEARFDAP